VSMCVQPFDQGRGWPQPHYDHTSFDPNRLAVETFLRGVTCQTTLCGSR